MSVLALTLLLAACGASGQDTVDAQTAASPTPTAPASKTAAPAPSPAPEPPAYARSAEADSTFRRAVTADFEQLGLTIQGDLEDAVEAVIAACASLERGSASTAWTHIERASIDLAESDVESTMVIGYRGTTTYCPEHLNPLVDAAPGRWSGTTETGSEIDLNQPELAFLYPAWPGRPVGTDWVPASYEEQGMTAWDTAVAFKLDTDNYDCSYGASACSGVHILVRETCASGLYVELAFLTGSAVTDKGNEITAALYPWEQAYVGIDAYGQGGDSVRVSDINCM